MKKVLNVLKKHKTKIAIVVLPLVFIVQLYLLCKYAYAGYMFDFDNNKSDNAVEYYMLDMTTDYLIDSGNVNLNSHPRMTMLFSKDAPYEEFGIGYLYLRWKLYPGIIGTYSGFYSSIETLDKLDSFVSNSNLDYILLLGKDTKLFDNTSDKDYTLYRVVDSRSLKLEKVSEIDFSLYDLSIYYSSINKIDYFNSYVEKMKEEITNYWDLKAIQYIYNYATDLYENGDYNLAIEYMSYYLNNVDYINDDLNMMMADIYSKTGDYETAINYLNICLRNKECDSSIANNKINEFTSIIERGDNND